MKRIADDRATASASTPPSIPPSTRGPIRAGVATILIGVVGFGSWAALTPLEGGVVGSGHIAVETERNTLQHLEGGIVTEILAREGEQVEAGEVLMRLKSLSDTENAESLERQRLHLLARQSRLATLRARGSEWQPPAAVVEAAADDTELADMLAMQVQLFDSERAALEAETSVLRQRIRQQLGVITSLRERDRARKAELAIVLDELAAMAPLLEQQVVSKTDVNALNREKARLDGIGAEIDGEIVRAQELIEETRMQLASLFQDAVRKWSEELSAIEEERTQIERDLAVARDKLTRHDLVAPLAGTVMNLRYVTEGGVVAPGAPILDIVPAEEALSVDLQLRPSDIDDVRVGMPARVRILALSHRTAPVLIGEVVRVSPDTHTDENNGQTFYTARVQLDVESVAALSDAESLYPGMPADVVIVSSKHTLLAALLRPVSDAIFRSFRN